MTYRLGVDLGTTFTSAAIARGGTATLLGLGDRALQMPSMLYLPPTGELVVGESAERHALDEPDRVVGEVKPRIGDSVPVRVAGVPFSPQALTAGLLRRVVRVATEQQGGAPSLTVVTHPANWGPFKRSLLDQVVQLADVGAVELCPEPLAAAVHHTAGSQVHEGERLAVYDLGGGTFDACVLERTATGFALLGEPVGIGHLAGVDFDEALFGHVLAALTGYFEGLELEDDAGRTALARLRRDVVDIKEALSCDHAADLQVSLPGMTATVRITRRDLEDLIRAPLAQTVEALARAVRSAGLEPSDLSSILLVGGGSRIPLVAEMLQQEFWVPVVLGTHPTHDIAAGAALAGGMRLEPAPVPAAARWYSSPSSLGPVEDPPRYPPALLTGPDRRPVPLRRATTGVATGAAALALALAVSGFALSHGDDRQQATRTASAARTVTSAAVTAPTPLTTASRTPIPAPVDPVDPGHRPPALPVSAPLRADQMVIPMQLAGNWDLYLGQVGRLQPVARLTRQRTEQTGPVVSPDRRSIVFLSEAQGVRQLFVMAADGTGTRRLFRRVPAECAGRADRPAWNRADPTELATVCADARGRTGLYLLRTDGTVVRRFGIGSFTVGDPAFSPDGRSLAFQGHVSGKGDGGSLFVAPTDGGVIRRLTRRPAGSDADPVFTTSGDDIVFRRDKGGNLDLWTIPADGSSAGKPLVTGPANDQDPTLSPDGTQMAFKSDRLTVAGAGHGNKRVWLLPVDGTGRPERLFSGVSGEKVSPGSWSPR